MGLPRIAVPEYSLKLPSDGTELKYRPFLVKEEKILLMAMESENEKEIINATKNVINNCDSCCIPKSVPRKSLKNIARGTTNQG